ncbi:hypothetical protein SAMN05216553_106223 [Lentzea fradiae]|uniref:Uncharacterized protein n=1 Tax=Lentzea fradiae TaxID=200378 RepID=A0A1G7SF34_9PSEU|nr:hypothetical protein [Lentzea fradiae]SDG21666.1 hypothetical protein SAMN05216553_106223 [Lentzea fradiae]
MIDSSSPKNEETLRRLAQLQKQLDAAEAALSEGGHRGIRETVLDDVREALRIAEEVVDQNPAGERADEVVREELFLARNQIHAANELGGVTAEEPPGMSYRNLAGRIEHRIEALDGGRRLVASPTASEETPHHFPGGQVRGRLVPRGWYSHDWWRDIEREWRWRRVETAAAGVGGVVVGSLAYAFYRHIATDHASSGRPLEEWLQGVGGAGHLPADITRIYDAYVDGSPVGGDAQDPSGLGFDSNF